jgi:hypothetical protein
MIPDGVTTAASLYCFYKFYIKIMQNTKPKSAEFILDMISMDAIFGELPFIVYEKHADQGTLLERIHYEMSGQ